jgi:hypothetical protein
MYGAKGAFRAVRVVDLGVSMTISMISFLNFETKKDDFQVNVELTAVGV